MNFDQTLLKAYSCPRRGSLLAHDEQKGKRSSSGPAETGRAVHSLIAEYWMHCQKVEEQTDFSFATELMRSVDDQEARRIFEAFINSELVNDSPCWIEMKLESGRWYGTPDLVEFPEPGLVVIHDWKTDRRIWSQGEAEDNIQLKLYALLVRDRLMSVGNEPPDAYQLIYHFVRYGEIKDFFMTAEELVYFEQDLEERARKIEEGGDEPRAGSWCGFCEYPITCPLAKSEDFPVIVDAAQALEIAARLHALRRAEAVLTDSLKEWVNRHGEIKGADWTLGFFSHPRETYPDGRAVYDILADYDVPVEEIWKILHPSKSDLKRIVKKVGEASRKEVSDKLAAVAKITQQTKFEFKRAEGDEVQEAR